MCLVYAGLVSRYYYACCHDGNYHENKLPQKIDNKHPHQRPTRKLNATCISRMYVDEFVDHVEVKYITAHNGHELGVCELPFLPLPPSVKESVAIKISQGIPSERNT